MKCIGRSRVWGPYRTFASKTQSPELTCGLEIHAQIKSPRKLFSNTETSFHAEPNSKVSYFDAALPGTQPKLNYHALMLSLRAAMALNCTIRDMFSFDRKHYFYGDQPTGYQITQHYSPFATSGHLLLLPRDGVEKDLKVRIKHIQIEQDTGKSTYIDDETHVDLNRANHSLIEIVTEPDIHSPVEAGVFVKKLQQLLRYLDVCTGELETGAMRVDVNVSVGNGERCEIKNISSTSAIVDAIKFEYSRQVEDAMNGKTIQRETRGWDGKSTWKLRGKEDAVDYRYMPDPDLPVIAVSDDTMQSIRQELPSVPDDILEKIISEPYFVPFKDAKTLMNSPQLLQLYLDVFGNLSSQISEDKRHTISNWIAHKLLGELNLINTEFDPQVISAETMSDIILALDKEEITSSSAGHILKYVITTRSNQQVTEIIDQFDLGKVKNDNSDVKTAISELCQIVIKNHPDVAKKVKTGKKPKSLKFLLGQVMKECQGKIEPSIIEQELKDQISSMH